MKRCKQIEKQIVINDCKTYVRYCDRCGNLCNNQGPRVIVLSKNKNFMSISYNLNFSNRKEVLFIRFFDGALFSAKWTKLLNECFLIKEYWSNGSVKKVLGKGKNKTVYRFYNKSKVFDKIKSKIEEARLWI